MKSNPLHILSKIAVSRGGQLLSSEYSGSRAKLLWKCKCGYEWKAPGYSIKSGHWCPSCGEKKVGKQNRRYSLDDAIAYAHSRGGECVSSEYFTAESKLEWKCSEGHIWSQSLGVIRRQNLWCPYCSGMHKTIEDMRKLADERNGECLSVKYCDAKIRLEWRCKNGHKWQATPDSVKHGSWCPYCGTHFNEEKCRFILESLTGLSFPKTRRILGGRELDGYNHHLKLAFEYNGKQHYQFCPHFHRHPNSLEQIQKTDNFKVNLCEEKGITLIVVPYWCIGDEALLEFIKNRTPTPHYPVFFDRFCRTISIIKQMNDVAKARDGECLSDTYISAKSKLRWKCKNGHTWEARADDVKNKGSWCPYCAGRHLKK